MNSLLSLREIRAGYGEREVVRGASLTVEAGEFCALLGLNGCGKNDHIRPFENLPVVNQVYASDKK